MRHLFFDPFKHSVLSHKNVKSLMSMTERQLNKIEWRFLKNISIYLYFAPFFLDI